jgi:hypothetical protein
MQYNVPLPLHRPLEARAREGGGGPEGWQARRQAARLVRLQRLQQRRHGRAVAPFLRAAGGAWGESYFSEPHEPSIFTR